MGSAGLLLLLAALAGGGASGEPGAIAWDGRSTKLHVDEVARVRFAVPAAGFLVTAHHFPPDAPPGAARDSLLVAAQGDQVLLVETYANPEGLSARRFLDKYLSYLRDPATTALAGTAGKAEAPAILLDQPRSGQAFGQRIAVFALGARVFKIACPDRDDPVKLRLFERAVASFEEVAP